MKKNIKNILIITFSTAVLLFEIFIPLRASFSKTIMVSVLNNTPYQQAVASDILKPQAFLNDYEMRLEDLINKYRIENGVNAVKFDGTLTFIAKIRSQDLIDRNYFSHYTPEGTTVFNLLRSYGINFITAGENLANAGSIDVGTPEAFMEAWSNSPSHRANMLKGDYNYIGVGMVDQGDRIVATIIFAA